MIESEDTWNPTRRLHELLTAAKQRGNTRDQGGNYPAIRTVLGHALKVDASETLLIYERIKMMSEALDWTEFQIEKLPIRRKSNLTRHFPEFRNALNAGNLNASWETFDGHLSVEGMTDLGHAADRLLEYHGESDLEKEELEQLCAELEELIEIFHSSEIDTDLRIAMLDLLNTAKFLLSEYRIRGGDALKKIIELTIGGLVTRRSQLEKANSDPFKKLWSWLNKIDGVYGRLGKYARLLPPAAGWLLGNSIDKS